MYYLETMSGLYIHHTQIPITNKKVVDIVRENHFVHPYGKIDPKLRDKVIQEQDAKLRVYLDAEDATRKKKITEYYDKGLFEVSMQQRLLAEKGVIPISTHEHFIKELKDKPHIQEYAKLMGYKF